MKWETQSNKIKIMSFDNVNITKISMFALRFWDGKEIDTNLNAAKTTLSQLDFLIFISDVLSSV